jgi:hypothetical protein
LGLRAGWSRFGEGCFPGLDFGKALSSVCY